MQQDLPFEKEFFETRNNDESDLSGVIKKYRAQLKPRKSVIQKIMNYSKALKVEKSKYIGSVEVLTN